MQKMKTLKISLIVSAILVCFPNPANVYLNYDAAQVVFRHSATEKFFVAFNPALPKFLNLNLEEGE